MAQLSYVSLTSRAVITVTGEDRVAYLQGLVSNDVTKASEEKGLYAAFLTPQGKFLHELFLAELEGTLLLETETSRSVDFAKRLSMYKLRSKVTVDISEELDVYALLGEDVAEKLGLSAEAGAAKPFGGGIIMVDPRHASAGLRAWLPRSGLRELLELGFEEGDLRAWDEARIRLGLPDGSRDLEPEKSLLLENGFDELKGVDFQKGCYMGQELTARTKYRALIRKRLLPVQITGTSPPPGTLVMAGEVEAGEMRSHCHGWGLALLKLEHLDKSLTTGEASLHPVLPDWVVLPDAN